MNEDLIDVDSEFPFVAGIDGTRIEAKHLVLGVEKFRLPIKHYRLIWVDDDLAWLAEEDETWFRRVSDAVEAGQAIAEKYGARKFDERTR